MIKQIVLSLLFLALVGCVTVETRRGELTDEEKAHAAKDRLELGLAYLNKGNRKRAKQNLDKAYSHAPDDPSVNFGLAYFYQQVGELKKAERHYKNSVNSSVKSADAHNNYGTFLCQLKRYDEAKEQYLKALDIATYLNVATTYENLGLCSMRAGDYTNAEIYLEKALEHDPLLESSALSLVELAIISNNYQLADKQMTRYLAKAKRHTLKSVDMAITIAVNLGLFDDVKSLKEIKKKIESLEKQ